MTGPAEIARGLTKAQLDALVNAATFLDLAAGQGIGMIAKDDSVIDADVAVLDLAEAFGIQWGDDFGLEVKALLERQTDGTQ